MKTKKTSTAKKIKRQALPEPPEHFMPRRTKEGEKGEEHKHIAPRNTAPRPRWHPADENENELPLDAEPAGSRPLPPPFAHVLEGVLQKLRLRVSPAAELLRGEWEALLPPEFKGRCLPGKILRGFFYAYVPDSTALFELRRELPRMEAALAPKLAEMKAKHVRLMIDPEAFKGTRGGT